MMRRAFLVSTLVLAAARLAGAQNAPKAARIGWVTAQRAASLAPNIGALQSALADLGYVEGRNLTIEFRYGDDAVERVPELAAELERIPVDLIMAQGEAVSVINRLGGLKVPVVYFFSGDPVAAGFADSLARPRGNMTGLTFMAAELNGKRLEMLRDIIPNLGPGAIVANSEHPGSQLERTYSEAVGRGLGLT